MQKHITHELGPELEHPALRGGLDVDETRIEQGLQHQGRNLGEDRVIKGRGEASRHRPPECADEGERSVRPLRLGDLARVIEFARGGRERLDGVVDEVHEGRED